MARSTVAQRTQIGRESVPGTQVPAAKSLQSLSLDLSPSVESTPFTPKGSKFTTVVTPNQEWVEGDLSGTPTYEEIIYPLSSILCKPVTTQVMNGATPTGAYEHVYSPATFGADQVNTFTVETTDGVQTERINHVLFTEFGLEVSRSQASMSGSVIGQRLEIGQTQTASPTAVAAEVTPIAPGQVCIYAASTPAGLSDTANRQGAVLSLNVSVGGRFNPVWFLNCTLPSFSTFVEAPEPEYEAEYSVEANPAGLEWLTRWRAGETRFIRMEATGPQVVPGQPTTARLFRWDMAVKVSEPGEMSDTDGVWGIAPTLRVVHDPTWGRALQVTVRNTVAAVA